MQNLNVVLCCWETMWWVKRFSFMDLRTTEFSCCNGWSRTASLCSCSHLGEDGEALETLNYTTSCRVHMYNLMFCGNMWNVRGIMETEWAHSESAGSAKSSRRLNLTALWGEEGKIKTAGYMIESFFVLVDLDSLRLILSINFISSLSRRRL